MTDNRGAGALTIQVALADDHPLVLSGLAKLIGETEDLRVVATCSDGRQVLLLLEDPAFTCDVLVLDLSLPKVSGLEVLRRAQRLQPALKVVVLSMYPEQQYAVRVLSEGAAAYLAKSQPVEDVLAAIRQVARAGAFVTGAQAAQLVQGPNAAAPPHTRLSAREHQVFLLLIHGSTPSEVAAELDLSISTVSTHLARIKEKLGARTLAEVVSYAHRAGLVD